MTTPLSTVTRNALALCDRLAATPHRASELNHHAAVVAAQLRTALRTPVLWMHRDNPALTTAREPLGTAAWVPLYK